MPHENILTDDSSNDELLGVEILTQETARRNREPSVDIFFTPLRLERVTARPPASNQEYEIELRAEEARQAKVRSLKRRQRDDLDQTLHHSTRKHETSDDSDAERRSKRIPSSVFIPFEGLRENQDHPSARRSLNFQSKAYEIKRPPALNQMHEIELRSQERVLARARARAQEVSQLTAMSQLSIDDDVNHPLLLTQEDLPSSNTTTNTRNRQDRSDARLSRDL